jgi:hypothetical protein
MPWAIRRKLKERGFRVGANPRDWYALSEPVPCADLPLEIETNGVWTSIGPDDLLSMCDESPFVVVGL